MDKKYLIGLDGGGTKTKCVITDLELKPLHVCQGGPSNFLIIGMEIVSKTILNLILECMNELKISSDEIASIFIGTTGAGRINDAKKLKDDFFNYARSNGYVFNIFNVDSDARIALEGAFSGMYGALLIAGTGSIIFGKDKNGNIHRVGGLGKLIGDEGSGISLGKKGLNQVAREFDKRGKNTLLTQILKRDFGISNSSELITAVYNNNFDLASFAPSVIEAASCGDEIALQIIEHETDELLLHVKTIYNLIGEKSLNLCFVGGTIVNDNIYSAKLRDKIKELGNINILETENPPEIGAAYMAKSFI